MRRGSDAYRRKVWEPEMTNRFSQFNDAIVDEFRSNNGTVARFGRDLVLVHHIGAKSGRERIAPVMGLRESPDSWLIAASKAGADDNPAWYANLLAHPDVQIETPDDGLVRVHVTDLAGEQRDAAWDRFTTASPGFRAYQEKTARIIPVLRLTRR